MRPMPVLGDPAVPRGLVLPTQSHIGKRGVGPVPNDPAIPKPQFVDSLWARLARPLGPKAIDDVNSRAGDRLHNFPRRLLELTFRDR